MNAEEEKAKRIIQKHKSDLKTISEEIVRGASEGCKQGIADGVKKGVQSGLQDCLKKGFMNIGPDYIKDIPRFADTVKKVTDRIKGGVKPILTESAEDCLETICQKTFAAIQKDDVKLPEDQTERILDLIKISGLETLNKAVKEIPSDLLFSGVVSGIKEAWEDSLTEAFKGYEKRYRNKK
jgi:hypothetical protein